MVDTLPALTTVPAGSADQQDAFTRIRQYLIDNGLPESLAAWAWEQLLTGHGPDTIALELQQRPEFKQAFPEIELRKKAGLAPLAPAEILAWRQQAAQTMRQYGLPPSFFDQPSDFTNFIVNDWSVSELKDAIENGLVASQQSPQETRDELQQLYGIGPGDLAAFWLDPARAQPLLEKKFALASAQTAGTAQRSGFGQLSRVEAENLTRLGVNENQAGQGFGELVHQRELFNPLAGESADQIGRDEQLSAAFGGNEYARERIRRRAEARRAQFEGGGSVAAGQRGITGLGSAVT